MAQTSRYEPILPYKTIGAPHPETETSRAEHQQPGQLGSVVPHYQRGTAATLNRSRKIEGGETLSQDSAQPSFTIAPTSQDVLERHTSGEQGRNNLYVPPPPEPSPEYTGAPPNERAHFERQHSLCRPTEGNALNILYVQVRDIWKGHRNEGEFSNYLSERSEHLSEQLSQAKVMEDLCYKDQET
ncbi:hypothetical protein PTMSG1_03082 [Pyrenophora teres f. maculata]|nr:hypothetical protein PTMSG1_03082 [Pyrenophora teres f. maculata]